MNVANYDFYGQLNQRQSALIDLVNDRFEPPISEIAGGMCYMLSMQLLLDYLGRTDDSRTPENIFDRLTDAQDGGAYLRQIAGNFRAYIDSRFSLGNLSAQTGTYISELSRRRYEGTHMSSFSSSTVPSSLSEPDSPRHGLLIVLFYTNSDGTESGHAVAVVHDSAGYALYDPNYGICRFSNVSEICTTVLPALYCQAGVREHLYLIRRLKED